MLTITLKTLQQQTFKIQIDEDLTVSGDCSRKFAQVRRLGKASGLRISMSNMSDIKFTLCNINVMVMPLCSVNNNTRTFVLRNEHALLLTLDQAPL